MVEKITVVPQDVRGLGNIVSKKEIADFMGSSVSVGVESGVVNGVGRSVFVVSTVENTNATSLSIVGSRVVSPTDENITFTASLVKNSDSSKVPGVPIRCFIGNEEYTVTSNGSGDAVFTILNELSDGNYNALFVYNDEDAEVSWCYKNFSFIVGDHFGLEVISTNNDISSTQNTVLIGKLSPGVKEQTISFYEEYLATFLRLKSSKSTLQLDDTCYLTARLVDEDGSAVSNETISFYEEYLATFLRLKSSSPALQIGDSCSLTARLVDEDGSGIVNETVSTYAEYPTLIIDDMTSDSGYWNFENNNRTYDNDDGLRIVDNTISLKDYWFKPPFSLEFKITSGRDLPTITIGNLEITFENFDEIVINGMNYSCTYDDLYHFKIVFTDTATIYVNNELITNVPFSKGYVSFQIQAGRYSGIYLKDVKIIDGGI